MKNARIVISFLFLMTLFLFLIPALAHAQKEHALPKDLPPYGPLTPFSAPAVKAIQLDNGLTVWMVSRGNFPKVAAVLAVRGGLAADPASRLDSPRFSPMRSARERQLAAPVRSQNNSRPRAAISTRAPRKTASSSAPASLPISSSKRFPSSPMSPPTRLSPTPKSPSPSAMSPIHCANAKPIPASSPVAL
jgi:hypothetical protein